MFCVAKSANKPFVWAISHNPSTFSPFRLGDYRDTATTAAKSTVLICNHRGGILRLEAPDRRAAAASTSTDLRLGEHV